MKKTIGIIGGGNMGEALIRGLVEKKLFLPAGILVCEADAKRAQKLKDKYRVGLGDLNTVITKSSIVILAVKPQDMESVLKQIKVSKDKLFISIAAGLTTKYFEDRLGGKARVIRAMPNLPALIGEGITGYCAGQFIIEGDDRKAGLILKALGKGRDPFILFDESKMDAVTAVSGSGPAYVFLFVEWWISAAISLGLNKIDARNLVYETLVGSADLLKDDHIFEAKDLRERVTSKGGTTEAAIKVFEDNNFGKLMKDALTAAKKRSEELAK